MRRYRALPHLPGGVRSASNPGNRIMTTPRDLATPLSRITWRDGQTLASRDLREDQRYADQLRYLHIRYQHKTWGVVEGLGVFSSGGSAVEVVPGYALDIEGRELLLPAFTRVAA